MADLFDTNPLIYSAAESHPFLQLLALNRQNFASLISKVQTLRFNNLEAADAIYFNSMFALITLLPITPICYLNSDELLNAAAMTLSDSLISGHRFRV